MTQPILKREPDDKIEVLAPDGSVIAPDLVPDLTPKEFGRMYRDMKFCRRFDERMISLQRQGRMGTYSSLAGQEGAQIGSTYALEADDTISYQYREHGALVTRGIPWEYLLYWMGHEAGNAALADINVLPLNITIGDHLPHAVGWAWAAKLNEDNYATVSHFGDGATSEGDFHEAMNFAGVYDAPHVFFCNNNGWAISVPREKQTASETLAQKATAYGFRGVQVDGMDPLATYIVTKAAREKACDPGKSERRPTLIEAIQYRFGAHTTADDPSVYRDEEQVKEWKRKDPIDRFELFCRNRGIIDNERIEAIEAEVDESISRLIDRAEAYESDPTEMFAYTFSKRTPRIEEQREYLQKLRETHGDSALLETE